MSPPTTLVAPIHTTAFHTTCPFRRYWMADESEAHTTISRLVASAMWVETSDGSDQGRVVGIGRIHTDEARTRAAILDPAGFTQGLLQGAHATMLPSEDGTRFEWGIDLPLVGTTGIMHMREQPDGVLALDGESGALGGARWRFRTRTRDYGTLLVAWGRFDLGDGLWLVRVVQDADPAFRPGLSSSAELMMVRGLRTRLSM